jgi:hypothetical protein
METGRTDCCGNREQQSHKMTKPRRRGRRKRNNYGDSGCDNRKEEVIVSETVQLTTEES